MVSSKAQWTEVALDLLPLKVMGGATCPLCKAQCGCFSNQHISLCVLNSQWKALALELLKYFSKLFSTNVMWQYTYLVLLHCLTLKHWKCQLNNTHSLTYCKSSRTLYYKSWHFLNLLNVCEGFFLVNWLFVHYWGCVLLFGRCVDTSGIHPHSLLLSFPIPHFLKRCYMPMWIFFFFFSF